MNNNSKEEYSAANICLAFKGNSKETLQQERQIHVFDNDSEERIVQELQRLVNELKEQTRDLFFVVQKFQIKQREDEQKIILCLQDPKQYQKMLGYQFKVLFPKIFQALPYKSRTQKDTQERFNAKSINLFDANEAIQTLKDALSSLKGNHYLLFTDGSVEIRTFLSPPPVDYSIRISDEITEKEVLTDVSNFQKDMESIKHHKIEGKRGFGMLQRVKIRQMEQAKEDQKAAPSASRAEEQIDTIDYEEQDPFQTKMQQKLIEKVANSILLDHRCLNVEKYPVGYGLLLPQKSTRGIEKSLVDLFQNLHQNKSEIKTMILVNSNKRGEQIANEIENSFSQTLPQTPEQNKCETESPETKEGVTESKTEPPKPCVKFQKYLNSKKGKEKQHQVDWREEVSYHQVMLMHNKKFLQLLVHCDLQIEAFDLIVFDEINASFPDHPNNQIMQSFYYNHIPRNQKPLPYILGFCNFESLFKTNANPQKVTDNLKSLCNMFNSKLQALTTNDMLEVQNFVLKQQVRGLRYEMAKPFSYYSMIDESLTFNQLLRQYMHVQSKNGNRDVNFIPHPEIFKLKQFNPFSYLTTTSLVTDQVMAKMTLSEAKSVIEAFLAILIKLLQQFKVAIKEQDEFFDNTSTQSAYDLLQDEKAVAKKTEVTVDQTGEYNKYLKPRIVSIQHVTQKIRYFSSFYHVNWVLLPFFENIADKKNFKYFNRHIIDLEPTEPDTTPVSYIFKKKLESEDYVMLEMVHHLSSKGFIDEHLRPNEKHINEALQRKFVNFDDTGSVSTVSYSGTEYQNTTQYISSASSFKTFSTATSDHNAENFENLKRFINLILNPILKNTVKESKVRNQSPHIMKLLKEKNKVFGNYENFVKHLFTERQLFQLASNIDSSVQHITLPKYMTQHLTESQVEHFKGVYFMYILIIALSKKEFQDPRYEAINQEINRLQFLGDQTLSLNIVTFLFFTRDQNLKESDLDREKIEIIKTQNYEKKGQNYRLPDLLLDIDSSNQERSISDVIQGLGGFLSLYINPDASLLFLQELKIIEFESQDLPLHKYLEEKRKIIFKDPENEENVLKLINGHGMTLLKHDKLRFDTAELEQFVQHSTRAQPLADNDMSISQYSTQADTVDIISKNASTQQTEALFTIEESKEHIQVIEKVADIQQQKPVGCLYQQDSEIVSTTVDHISASPQHVSGQSQNYSASTQQSTIINESQFFLDGYKFNNKLLLVQAFTHRSFSEKLAVYLQQNETQVGDQIPNFLKTFNYQRLEYLGDPILNFSVAKLFYFETIDAQENWHTDYYPSMKLHDLKTWFTSNNWLAFLMYEQFYYYKKILMPLEKHNQSSIQQPESQQKPQQQADSEKVLPQQESQDDSKKVTIQQKKQEEIEKAKLQQQQQENIEKAMLLMPQLPLLYDDENDLFHKQLQKYQYEVSKRFASFDSQFLNKNSRLSLSGFRTTNEDDDQLQLQDLQDTFVKFFSDVFEGLIGAIYLDSGDFDRTSEIVLQLLRSRFVEFFPLKENERTKVLTVWNSKPYACKIKLSHASEDRENESVLRGYMHNMEVRRVKFTKEQKKKIPNFYRDLRKYLEVAYYKFEMKYLGKELTGEMFLEFNRGFRREYNIKEKVDDRSYLKNVADQLAQKFTQQISDPQQQETALINEFKAIDSSRDQKFLVELEHERVRVTKIRQILSKADIKTFIQHYSSNIETLIKSLHPKQLNNLYTGLWNLGEHQQIAH